MIRTAGGFPRAEFALNVCKSVRKDHVQTGEHWTSTTTTALGWRLHPAIAAGGAASLVGTASPFVA